MAIRVDRQSTRIRRRQIIDAARDLITSTGMESLTIDAIAEAVGMTEGAIYRHFVSKSAILSLLIDDIRGDSAEHITRRTRGGGARNGGPGAHPGGSPQRR